MAQNFENFHENMNFPKSIQNQSGMVPGSPGHEKTSIWIHCKLPELWKNIKILEKMINSKIGKSNEIILMKVLRKQYAFAF